jgi:hypothetical protein
MNILLPSSEQKDETKQGKLYRCNERIGTRAVNTPIRTVTIKFVLQGSPCLHFCPENGDSRSL